MGVGCTRGGKWLSEADSLMALKAKHLTMLAFEKTVMKGKGSAFDMLGNDKLSKVHKARM